MKRVLAALSAGLLAAALVAPLAAQPIEEEVEEGLPGIAGGDPTADPGALGIDPDATAAAAGTVDMDGVIASIRAGHAGAGALENVASVASVIVVPVTDLPGGRTLSALDEAVAERRSDIEELRETIRGNDLLRQEIEGAGVTVNDVVAADVGADGTITIYVR